MPRTKPPDLSPWFVPLDDIEGTINWTEFFGNDNPVEIDVGSGRGLFLVHSAEANPDINYLGIEIDYREGRRSARRLRKREFPNARVIGGDARFAMIKHVRPGSVSAVHVYFPDPWWKRRHRRRRVFTDEFADLAASVLEPDGLLHSWTDVEEYFEVISGLMDHHPKFETLPPPQERDPEHDLDFQTSFERRKRKAGRPIYRGRWRRIASKTERAVGQDPD
jgi:tRNA (guanine-N7-)-methyltransferase